MKQELALLEKEKQSNKVSDKIKQQAENKGYFVDCIFVEYQSSPALSNSSV